MGTNYYLHERCCPECGRSDPPLHIGKSSAGWCFSLHVVPANGLRNLADWRKRWSDLSRNSEIRNEYDEPVTIQEMEKIITERSWPRERKWSDEELRMNYAEPGPNGLLRHSPRDPNCHGHEGGTWDLIEGEFS